MSCPVSGLLSHHTTHTIETYLQNTVTPTASPSQLSVKQQHRLHTVKMQLKTCLPLALGAIASAQSLTDVLANNTAELSTLISM
jgi:hypothetical protein